MSVLRPAGISYLEIPADDPRRAAGFYHAVFGWQARDRAFEDGSGDVIGHFVPGKPAAEGTGMLPYVDVERVDDALTRVAEAGGAVIKRPYPEGDLWVATFRDPAGNVVGVWQRGPC